MPKQEQTFEPPTQLQTRIIDTSFIEKVLDIQTNLSVPKGLKNSYGGFNYRNLESIETALKPYLEKHKLLLTLSYKFIPLPSQISYVDENEEHQEKNETYTNYHTVHKNDTPQEEVNEEETKNLRKTRTNNNFDKEISGQTTTTVLISKNYKELATDPGHIEATAMLTDGSNYLVVTALAREANNKKGMDSAQVSGAATSYAGKYALQAMFRLDDTKDPDSDEYIKQIRQEKTPLRSRKNKETSTFEEETKSVEPEDTATKPVRKTTKKQADSSQETPTQNKEYLAKINEYKKDPEVKEKMMEIYKKKFGGKPLKELDDKQIESFIKAIEKL